MADTCQAVQRRFRGMIVELSGRLTQTDCESITYLVALPECCTATSRSMSLHVLSSLEANGHINPLDVQNLNSLLGEINRHDLLSTVSGYQESKEYKDALKERKKKGKKKRAAKKSDGDCASIQNGDNSTKMSDRKMRLRSLYTLLITHITGLTQVMEILRDELDKIGEEEEKVDQAMEKFLTVAKDGTDFTDNLHKVFRDMGIKPNRDSSSSEETPAATPTTGLLRCSTKYCTAVKGSCRVDLVG